LFALAGADIAAAAASAPASQDRWYAIYAEGGAHIGHASREVIERADGREVVESYSIRVQEEGEAATSLSERTIVREDRSGRTVSIAAEARNGRGWVRSEALIGAGRADVIRRTGTDLARQIVALPPGVRFDDGDGLLRAWDPQSTPRLEFDAFSIGANGIERVVIAPLGGATRDAQGRLRALRLRYERGQVRGISRLLLGPGGEILEVDQPMFGSTITLRATDRTGALRRPSAYSPLRSALVRSPYRVPPDALQGRIRYRFAYREGVEFPLPETGEQRALPEMGGITIDICGTCGPGLATDPTSLAEALAPTPWLQIRDARIRSVAAPVAGMSVSEARKMAILAERARSYLTRIDFTGHFSAVEAMSRGAGDCTEAAVLLAAFGRAAGIPTRVASGLVYSRQRYHGVSNVFMPHSWVLAFVDGRWRSFDAALEGFDATHIALTVGDGDPRSINAANQLAGLLEWREMTEVRRRSPG
jgi:hypothetical protein